MKKTPRKPRFSIHLDAKYENAWKAIPGANANKKFEYVLEVISGLKQPQSSHHQPNQPKRKDQECNEKNGELLHVYEAGGGGNCGPLCMAAHLSLLTNKTHDQEQVRATVAAARGWAPIPGKYWVDEDWEAAAQCYGVTIGVFHLPKQFNYVEQFLIKGECGQVIYILNTDYTHIHPYPHYQVVTRLLSDDDLEICKLKYENFTVQEMIKLRKIKKFPFSTLGKRKNEESRSRWGDHFTIHILKTNRDRFDQVCICFKSLFK